MSFLRIAPLAFLISSIAWAESDVCGNISNYQQIIACAESRSPEVVRAEASLKQKNAFKEASAQLRNPELSFETVTGSVNSGNITETDISLAFPIELGGKRSARKEVASGEAARAEAELFLAKASVRKKTILKLLRLRQFYTEQALVEESLETFTRLVKQYESRPLRSPEQDVSLTVYRIAKGEYGFKKMQYDEESAELESYFKVNVGLDLVTLRKSLSSSGAPWPKLNQGRDLAKSPVLAMLEADVSIAKAELAKAQGDSWPTLNIGPSAKFAKEGGQSYEQFGVNLSMPIPVLNLNGGNRAVAGASLQSAEVRKSLALRELQAEKLKLQKLYQSSVVILEQTPGGNALDKNHKRMESHFVKGVVPSSLVIEAHRSLVEFERTRNERESKAVEAYLDLQIIDGQPVEWKL
ncbi:TolC family protein [Bdellovibrio bacteriovorus]|uniref:TolC family protein n=1 Tax=Bdellovibrio bacteriovorus TaxID=959 RepID=UPI0035A95680